MTVRLAGIGVPDEPAAWRRIECTVVDDAVPFANGALLLGRDGIVVADAPDGMPGDMDGVPLAAGDVIPPAPHPSGAFELDHLVVLTDSLQRTSGVVEEALGLECRRIRETDTVRQAFHRFADVEGGRGCIVELVESDRVDRTVVMGVVLNVVELFDLAERLGPDVMSHPKPAVQRGRYISTVRRGVGLHTAVALMTPG